MPLNLSTLKLRFNFVGANIFFFSHFFPLANAASRVTQNGRMLSGLSPFSLSFLMIFVAPQ